MINQRLTWLFNMERVKNCLVNALTATLFTRSFLAYKCTAYFRILLLVLCLGVKRTLQSNGISLPSWLSNETTMFRICSMENVEVRISCSTKKCYLVIITHYLWNTMKINSAYLENTASVSVSSNSSNVKTSILVIFLNDFLIHELPLCLWLDVYLRTALPVKTSP